jgi:hypothetical protein
MTMDETNPARAELARAITARDAAVATLEKAVAVEKRAEDLLFEKLAALEEARAAVVEAHGVSPLRLIEAATTGVLVMDRPLEMALTAESDAENDVAASRRVVATSRAAIAEAERALAGLQWRVDERCKPVLAAEAGRIIAGAEALAAKFNDARAVLSFLAASLPAGSPLRLRIDSALACAPARNLQLPEEWRKAHAALLRDAATPLPKDLN